MALRPITHEGIVAAFKSEIRLIKEENDLKFEKLTNLFQSSLQGIINTQITFAAQVQDDLKSKDKQASLDLQSLITEFSDLKSSISSCLESQSRATIPRMLSTGSNISADLSSVTSGSCQSSPFERSSIISSQFKVVAEPFDQDDLQWTQDLSAELGAIIADDELLYKHLEDRNLLQEGVRKVLADLRFVSYFECQTPYFSSSF
jgi:hypothetical protein